MYKKISTIPQILGKKIQQYIFFHQLTLYVGKENINPCYWELSSAATPLPLVSL